MARKCITDEELQKIIEDSNFEIHETLQSKDNGWESSSEEEDNVSMQEEHSDTEQTSSNSENSDSNIDIHDDIKFISKSGFQWNSQPPKSSKRRAHNIVTGSRISNKAIVPATKSLSFSNLDCWEYEKLVLKISVCVLPPMIPGFSLSDALDIIFANDDIANQVDEVFIEPPEATVDTDEDFAEEDQGGMLHTLTGRQLHQLVFSAISKVLEKVVKNHTAQHIINQKLLHPNQLEFQSRYSKITAMLKITKHGRLKNNFLHMLENERYGIPDEVGVCLEGREYRGLQCIATKSTRIMFNVFKPCHQVIITQHPADAQILNKIL
ncbi:hypothetical protein FQA39_LY13048 [Lamprigera yunnana]|nr:hypothetical protein FQA39_LY13048 [Lamprigera yunnana]